jgi:hypothetical protein
VAADSKDLSFLTAAYCCRPCPGNQNNGRPITRGFQRELEISADTNDLSGKFFHEQAFHFFLRVRLSCSSQAGADGGNVRRGDICRLHRQTSGFTNGSEGAAESHTKRVRGAAAALRANAK